MKLRSDTRLIVPSHRRLNNHRREHVTCRSEGDSENIQVNIISVAHVSVEQRSRLDVLSVSVLVLNSVLHV